MRIAGCAAAPCTHGVDDMQWLHGRGLPAVHAGVTDTLSSAQLKQRPNYTHDVNDQQRLRGRGLPAVHV